jgi:hypothetical protein
MRPPPSRLTGPLPLQRAGMLALTLCLFLVSEQACAAAARTAAARTAAVTPQDVKKAIEKGQAFLLSKEEMPAGRWETSDKRDGIAHDWQKMQGDAYGGFTALCTYALLASGEKPQDPRIAAAVDFLKKADIVGIYSIGMRCQVWYLLPPLPQNLPEMKKLWERELKLLENGINASGPNRGLWDYGEGHGVSGVNKGRIDHSVSQYGVLGMWALDEAGAEIDNRYWALLDSIWREHQFPDGGWVYDGTPQSPSSDKRAVTASMTAAGVATLFITDDMLHGQEGANCTGNVKDKNIDAGLNWMGEHFDQVKDNYALYGVERIGVASGYKYLGKVDWYTEGAERLVRSQKPDGSWTSSEPGAGPLTDTSFALLFLSRGSAPVMVNKLDYRPVGPIDTEKPGAREREMKENIEFPWDQRPRDAANLARFIGRQTEGDLNWQIVNLNAPVEELHDAPILYISGSRALKLTDDDEKKIKLFVQQGGMILANADCPTDATGGPFAKSLRDLGSKLFGGEFRQLEPTHPLYTEEQYKPTRWKSRQPSVYGLTNGVRELMILLPADAARSWQTDSHISRAEQFEVGADIYQYATDKSAGGFKGETYLVKAVKPARRTTRVARLLCDENPDPEPAGWSRLDAIMRNGFETGIAAEPVRLGDGKLNGFKVAHLTGTTGFKWREEQLAEIKQFIEKGGTLIVDAAGGSAAFADSAEKELNALSRALGAAPAANASTEPTAAGPDLAGTVLPADHALYNLANAKIESFGYRNFTRHRIGGRLNVPRVRGIEVGKRVAVFYSREDLSAGLVGERVDGILGYDPETATAIMRNLLLYADPPPAPATRSAPTTRAAPTSRPSRPPKTPKPKPAAAPAKN